MAATDFKTHRKNLRLSVMALARMASVSRYRLWEFEQGGTELTKDEEQRLRNALRGEVARILSLAKSLADPRLEVQ